MNNLALQNNDNDNNRKVISNWGPYHQWGKYKFRKVKHNPFIRLDNSKTLHLTDWKSTKDAFRMIELLHSNNTGYFCLATKTGNKFSTRFFTDINDIQYNQMMNYLGLDNVYVSLNGFFIPNRKVSNIRQINCFYVDIDYYKKRKYKNKTCEQMIDIMRADGMFDILEPSFFVDSGNGMYIYYLLNDVPKQSSKLWSKIEEMLVNQFIPYGADEGAKDLARVLRLPGSTNSKTGRKARLILTNDNIEPIRYNLSHIRDTLLPKLPYTKKELEELKRERKKAIKNKLKTPKAKSNPSSNVIYIFNQYSLNCNRVNDIKQILALRDYDIKGIRNITFHLFTLFSFHAYGLKQDDSIWHSLIELNDRLKEPLNINELENVFNMSKEQTKLLESSLLRYDKDNMKQSKLLYLREQGCYMYTNSRIIQLLNIKANEMNELSTLIDSNEKNRRRRVKYDIDKLIISDKRKDKYKNNLRSKGKMPKKESLNVTYGKIKSLLTQGLKQKEICRKLKLSERTLQRHIHYIKENDL